MSAKDKMKAFILKHTGTNVDVTVIGDAISVDGDVADVQAVAAWFKTLNAKIAAVVKTCADDPEWAFVNVSMSQLKAIAAAAGKPAKYTDAQLWGAS